MAEKQAKNSKWTLARAESKEGLKLLVEMCQNGLNDIDIAAEIGVTAVTISRWRGRSVKLRAAMDDARGRALKTSVHDIQHIDVRDARTRPERYHKIALKPRKIDVSAVSDGINIWYNERVNKKLPLTRESLCKVLNISITEYRRMIEDRAILDDGALTTNTTSGVIRNEICEMLRMADNMILSDIVDSALSKNSIGAIFLLKNHWNYQDKTTTEIQDKTINVQWQQIENTPIYREDTRKTEDESIDDSTPKNEKIDVNILHDSTPDTTDF